MIKPGKTILISFPEDDFKSIIIDCVNECLKKNTQLKEAPAQHNFPYIPIQDIFKKKICSKPTFYAHLKAGEFTLYKFGNKSFVDLAEFQKAFQGVKFNNNKGGNKL